MWLFLSTEIMFFAALIGVYIVIRFGALAWPSPADVHLSEPIGAFNTFVLICSSVSIVLALEAAKRNQAAVAKGWVLLTLVLGTVFLGVKGFEYQAKFSHGIYPQKPRSQIYEKADVYYASAVRDRIKELRLEISNQASDTAAQVNPPPRPTERSPLLPATPMPLAKRMPIRHPRSKRRIRSWPTASMCSTRWKSS